MKVGALVVEGIGEGICQVTSGSYTGDEAANKVIPHGLSRTPIYVTIAATGSARNFKIVESGELTVLNSDVSATYTVTSVNSTNFYVGNGVNHTNTANQNALVYYWVAFA